MTEDLAERLRETTHMYQVDCELKMKCADRIEELETKLEKALEALEFYADRDYVGYDVSLADYGLSIIVGEIIKDSGDKARTTLAELKGEADAT